MPLDFNKPVDVEKKKSSESDYVLKEPKYQLEDIILTERQYQEVMLAVGYDRYKTLLMEQWGLKELYPENVYGDIIYRQRCHVR